MAAQDEARIVKTPEVLGGEPRIEGTRIGVYFVGQKVGAAGVDPHAVAAEHGLDVADVYRALAYNHDHPDEMDRIERRRARAVADARDRPTIEPPAEPADDG